MRPIEKAVATIVMAVFALVPLSVLAADSSDQIRRTLERRFGPILDSDGVDVRMSACGAVQVRMVVAPAHDSGRNYRMWKPNETQKILEKFKEVLEAEFPNTRFLPSSGIEIEDPGCDRRVVKDLRTFDRPSVRVLMRPDEARTESIWGQGGGSTEPEEGVPKIGPATGAGVKNLAPGAGGPDQEVSEGLIPPANRPAVPPPPLGTSASTLIEAPQPASGRPSGRPLIGFAAVDRLPSAEPLPAQPPTSYIDASRPVPEPRYPAQNGGYDRGRWPIGDLASRGPTVPASMYQYPRDNDALEYLIEREVGDAIRSTFKDTRVRARLVRPQVVKLFIEVAMHGQPGENRLAILHYSRDITLTVFREKFNLLRVHHQSRIRVTEADDRFSFDFRFHELTPYGERDRGEEDPIFRAIRLDRAFVIDVPRAYTIGRDGRAFSLGATSRRLSSGLYSNVDSSSSSAAWITLRHGFFPSLEASATYYLYSNTIVPARPNSSNSSGSLAVAALGFKYRLPYELNGLSLAVGLTQGFQAGAERRYYLPDDFERLYNLYVVGSRRIFENILFHLAAKRTMITQKPDFPDNGVASVGMGFEYLVTDRAILMLELKYDKYLNDTLTNFGTIEGGSGLNANAGVVFGTAMGDVEVAFRKLTVPTQKEITAGVAYRW